jgi:uncharacterized protein YuzB (UPF0349 family)
MKNKKQNYIAAAMISLFASMAHAAQIDVVATQTVTNTAFGVNVKAITANTTWTKDNIYILKDKVFVTNGATLTIEPGTKIYSTLDTKNTVGKDDDQFGALVITRGAKIDARGTADQPIVFTTTDELEAATGDDVDGDTNIASLPTATTAGRWGGIVILGNAPIASYSGSTNVGENRIEGFQPASSADLDTDGRADVIEYGGATAADNSGTLQYVSIRHGGYVYDAAAGSEINGLTLGGVGSGTTIDHIEVYANADDGIEFFGGTVNTSHIVLAFNQDDGFDIDEGYNGTNQFWFGIQAPKTEGNTSGHDNGGEWDGVTGTIADNATNSAPVIYNATFIGSGITADLGNDKGNNAIYIDDRFKGKVYNSVFDDFREDLIESSGDGPGTGMEFAHNTVGRFGAITLGNNLSYINGAGAANTFFDGSGNPINGNSAGGTDPKYSAYVRDASSLELIAIDPRPAANSPLWTGNGATLQSGAPVATTYRGAFGSENWAAGWTKMSEVLLFNDKVDVVATQTVTTTSFGANVKAITTNTTWTKDNIYILKDKVFVTNGATLTIEPGTKIYSTLDTKNTVGKDDDQFGALVITRGAKLNAAGTAENPIVFTTTDELEATSQVDLDGDGAISEAPTAVTAGRWGGIVILGNAPIASYSGSTNVGENRIEGFQPASSADLDTDGRADVIEYGGATAADNSGTLQYVSIRHGGYVYDAAAGSEINGLTLGGVGSGTTIDHIEVYANADDGIEFFGGTVNTSHIVLAFNQDDGFDIDEGYNGTNQFWFGIQAPKTESNASGHDNGGEWDGVTGTIADNATNSAPVIYNATFIGSGITADLGNDKGNNAIYIDDRFKGKVYNSLFHDFREDLIESSGDGPGTGMQFANNTIGAFGGGTFTGTNASNLTYLNGAGAANTFFDANGSPINGNTNGGVNPLLTSYERDGVTLDLISIDPRPASASPLWTNKLTAGAPVATTYRGAFGSDNWASGWTKLSQAGLLQGTSAAASSVVDADGDGIDDVLEATPAMTALGFSAGVNNVSNHGGVQGTSLFNSLYTSTSIQNLRGNGMMIGPVTPGGNATITLPLFKSDDLTNWTAAGNATATVPAPAGKQFFRIDLTNGTPNQ